MSKEIWDIQKAFTEKFFATKGGMPKGEKELTVVTKDYLLHLMKEVTEVLDQISFKMHRAPKDYVDRANVFEEMIDCQKFLWGLMQVWNFTYEEFENEFRRKSMVVEQRFAQESTMHELKDKPCVLVDIDGVLTDYPVCYYDWIFKQPWAQASVQGHALLVENYLRSMTIPERERVKREYRQSGEKAKLAMLPGARALLETIHEAGYKIILLTNRPYAKHFRIYPDTLEWLKNNELPYDAIIWARDKGFEAVKNFSNILWAVDDSVGNVKRLREAGIECVHLNPLDLDKNTDAFYSFIIGNDVLIGNAAKEWNERLTQ